MIRIMADTQADPAGIKSDTGRFRLTPAAVDRAKRITGHRRLADVGKALGYPYASWHRLRHGTNPKLAVAYHLADTLGIPVTRVFERCSADA